MGFPRQEEWSGLPCRSPRGLPGPRAPTCVSCIARQVLYQLSHLLVFIKRGLVAHSKPVCGIGGEGRGHHRQPVQVSSETFYLKHQQAPRVKVSALPASPWPPPTIQTPTQCSSCYLGFFKHLPKGDTPQARPSGAHRTHRNFSLGSGPICTTRKEKTHRVRRKDAQGRSKSVYVALPSCPGT